MLTDPDAVRRDPALVRGGAEPLSRAVYAEAYRESLTRIVMAGAAGCDECLPATTSPSRRLAGTGLLAAPVKALRERKAFAEMGGGMELKA